MSPGRAESNTVLREWCRDITGTVLSIGSSSDSDGDGGTYRRYFANADRYLTSEAQPDPRCDVTLDVRSMPAVSDGTMDAVFCSGVLEHVDDCHAAVAECWRVLKSGGRFMVGVPFNQHLHRAPQDFWRFTEFGVRHLLRAFTIRDLQAIGDPKHPAAYWAWAVK
jgi:SAM-dependent methyltransferase